MTKKTFRELLDQPGIIRAPGAYDAWSAKLIEQAGFPAVYMTGYGTSASVLGKPDIGLLTMTEMATAAGNIASAVTVPVIADADNGYGGELNVVRTVREYEKAGVSAIQLEDQAMPKRCGHMADKQIIGKREMLRKIKAAAYAKTFPDTVLIARTDARAVAGFDDAVDRAIAYADAGADVIFLEAPQSVEEMESAVRAVKKPMLANLVESGKTPFLPAGKLEEIGYKIVIYPVSALYAVTKTLQGLMLFLKEHSTTDGYPMVDFPVFNELAGLRELRETEKKFL